MLNLPAFYTMSLREICEDFTGETETAQVIPAAVSFLFNFPIDFYDPDKKTDFLEKWIHHFYMREIGLETVDYFLLRLQDKFDTILPYYNKLFAAVTLTYDPFITEKIDETITRNREETKDSTGKDTSTSTSTSEGTTNSTTTANGDTLHTESEYPQGKITDFTSNLYLSRASKDNGNNETTVQGSDTSENTANGTVDTTRKESITGEDTENRTANNMRGSAGVLLKEYLENMQNITKRFYDECEDLFMGLWL